MTIEQRSNFFRKFYKKTKKITENKTRKPFLLVEKLSHSHDHHPKDTKNKENYLCATLAYKPEWQILAKRCGWFQYHGTDKMENFPIFCKQTFWSQLLCTNKYILYTTILKKSLDYLFQLRWLLFSFSNCARIGVAYTNIWRNAVAYI